MLPIILGKFEKSLNIANIALKNNVLEGRFFQITWLILETGFPPPRE